MTKVEFDALIYKIIKGANALDYYTNLNELSNVLNDFEQFIASNAMYFNPNIGGKNGVIKSCIVQTKTERKEISKQEAFCEAKRLLLIEIESMIPNSFPERHSLQ
jgi:hypothetical protein